MILLVVVLCVIVASSALMVAVWRGHRRRPREHGVVLRNPDQKVRTPAVVRRARAPQRRSYAAHRRGRRRFR